MVWFSLDKLFSLLSVGLALRFPWDILQSFWPRDERQPWERDLKCLNFIEAMAKSNTGMKTETPIRGKTKQAIEHEAVKFM